MIHGIVAGGEEGDTDPESAAEKVTHRRRRLGRAAQENQYVDTVGMSFLDGSWPDAL
jgi:hypothetical protein